MFWSILSSVNVGFSVPDMYCDDNALVFNSDHGTGTSLLDEPEALLTLLSDVVELDFSAAPFNDNKAKSTLPDAGFMIVS